MDTHRVGGVAGGAIGCMEGSDWICEPQPLRRKLALGILLQENPLKNIPSGSKRKVLAFTLVTVRPMLIDPPFDGMEGDEKLFTSRNGEPWPDLGTNTAPCTEVIERKLPPAG